jgi:hypothetical protein
MLEEEIHVEALAQEASIEVGEYNQNGFDLAGAGPCFPDFLPTACRYFLS